MQRDVGAAPGIGGWRQVVGVGLASDFQHRQRDAVGHFGAAGEPLGIGPGLDDGFGQGIAFVGLSLTS